MAEVVERVSELERMIKELVYIQRQTEMKLASFIDEMKEFKEEIREDTRKLKEEMTKFKEEIREDTRKFKEEIREDTRKFKEEMMEFKNEMEEFKDFTEKNIASLNKKWGELANRLGTIAEDLVLPCFPETVEKYLGLKDPEMILPNTIVKRNGKTKEFDIIVIYSDTVVLNEVKATATEKFIESFVNFVREGEFFEYFPHLEGKRLLTFLSAMSFSEKALDILTQNGIYAVTPCPDMKIINFNHLQSE